MHTPIPAARLLLVAALALSGSLPAPAQEHAVQAQDAAARNTALVWTQFEHWRAGHGSVFDLLHEDVVWTVAGEGPMSGTYHGKQAFLQEAVAPITRKLKTAIRPTLRQIVAQGEELVVFWDGEATAVDGTPYRNHYAWQLTFEQGRIIRAVAYLDTWALDALMK
jgi:ketosteroid isomerase-like protein